VTLFRQDQALWLFDTGCHADRALLVAALDRRGLSPGDVDAVVLSHLHYDHCFNLPLFPKAKVYVAAAEIDYAEAVRRGEAVDHAIPDHWPALLDGRAVVEVHGALEVGEGAFLEVFPGHTPGCLVYLRQGQAAAALCGDAVKNAWEAVSGRAAMAMAGEEAASRGIRELMKRAQWFTPGHDRPFTHKDGEVVYDQPLDFEVRMNLYPEPRDQSVLQLHRPAGPVRTS
jgi:glyoxylase-like metal-dependent hydrolase (beta-lactamase superfamily II)